MSVLEIRFKDESVRTLENIDHCHSDGYSLSGYHQDGRLILQVVLATVDWFKVREASESGTGFPTCHSEKAKSDRQESLSHFWEKF